MSTIRKPRGIAARFWAGDSVGEIAGERCHLLHGRGPYVSPCFRCAHAIERAIRRDHARAVKGRRK